MAKVKVRKKQSLINKILRVLLFCFLIYFTITVVFNLISNQLNLITDRQELEQIQQKINATRLENDDLRRMSEDDLTEEYIIKIARELGFMHPDERVFIDVGR